MKGILTQGKPWTRSRLRWIVLVSLVLTGFNLAAERLLMDDSFEYAGEWVRNSGTWEIRDGGYAQTDHGETIATASRIVKQQGTLLYEFDIRYIEGLEDGYGGFGLHILIDEPTQARSWGQNESYLLWITYDMEAYQTNRLFAHVYRSTSPIVMDYFRMKGDEYPVAEDFLSLEDLMQSAEGEPVRIRFLINTATGTGRLYRPGPGDAYYSVDMGTPLGEGMHIGLRTNSLAAIFDNVTITRLDR